MKEIIDKIGIKKIITAVVGLIVIIALFIGGALLYNKYFSKKSYTEIENIMVTAAENYYEKNKDHLPKQEGEITTIEVKKLVKDEYMKSIGDYLKNDKIKCTGTVNVTNLNQKYRYTPILDCNEDYKTKLLVDYIKNNVDIVTNNAGLYELNNELVYRGELVNNLLEFANYNWRILKISEDKIYLILDETIKDKTIEVWDDRYNNEKETRTGINNYELSRARENLKALYDGDELFTDEEKLIITTHNAYVGKRKPDDEDKTGLIEKKNILENEYISLLPVYDYLNASIDPTCKSIETDSCSNYNYLAKYDRNWWLITGSSLTTDEVYRVNSGISIYNSKTNSSAYYRPVIALAKDTIYIEGTGTEEDPYKVK